MTYFLQMLSNFLLALVAIQNVQAHTLFSRLFIDGQDQGNGTCIRMPIDPSTATDPIANISSTDTTWGVNGTLSVPRICGATTNSTLTFEYRDWPNDPSRGSIDISHKGPCAVYLKKVASALTSPAPGDGWFKIWDSGYDASTNQWCTETLIANNGHLSVALPAGLEGGYYLVRPELLALHQADKDPSDPQFYVGCAQLFLQDSGTATGVPAPSDMVEIPGYVAEGQPALTFDIWSVPMKLPYPMPGPPIYSPVASANPADDDQNTVSSTTRRSTAQLTQTEGLKPPNCVLEVANWCGIELSPYTTEAGCWNASAACWDQCTACYAAAPPTGGANCAIWDEKCTAIVAACNGGDFEGPPDYMKLLTPPFATVSLPLPSPAQTGGGAYLPAAAAAGSGAGLAEPYSSGGAGGASSSSTVVANAATASASASGTAAAPKLTVSTDGACNSSTTCAGSSFGDCCSQHGWCGSTDDYCGAGCQAACGTCTPGTGTDASVKRRSHARHLSLHRQGQKLQLLGVGWSEEDLVR